MIILFSIFTKFAYSTCPIPCFEYKEIPNNPNFEIKFNEGDNYYACDQTFQVFSSFINATNCILLVYNSQFSSLINFNTNNYGGAIFLLNQVGGTTKFNHIICNCSFLRNSALKGGAIYIRSNYYRLSYSITYCYFEENGIYSKNEGCAIYFGSHDGRIEYCRFLDNGFPQTKGSIIYFLFHDRSTINNFVNISNNYFNYTKETYSSSLFAFNSNGSTLFRLNFENNTINAPEEPKHDGLYYTFYIFYGDEDFYYNHVGNISLQNNYYNVFDLTKSLKSPNFNVPEYEWENNSIDHSVTYIPPLVYEEDQCDQISSETDSIPEIESPTSDLPSSTFCIVSDKEEGTNETLFGRCDFTSQNAKTIVYIIDAAFADMREDEESGGAVHLLECALLCVRSSFSSCASLSGGGGAVYVKNDGDLFENVTFEKVDFFRCTALYGGAAYFYISSEANGLLIVSCGFVENSATSPATSAPLNGGDALYMTVRSGRISNSTFTRNTGSSSAVKFYNVFGKKARNADRLSEKVDSIVEVLNCIFRVDLSSTSCSVYFASEERGAKVELVGCRFFGKPASGRHYIEGEMLDERSPRMRISGCAFESEKVFDASANICDFVFAENRRLKSHVVSDLAIILCTSLLTAAVIFVVILTVAKNK